MTRLAAGEDYQDGASNIWRVEGFTSALRIGHLIVFAPTRETATHIKSTAQGGVLVCRRKRARTRLWRRVGWIKIVRGGQKSWVRLDVNAEPSCVSEVERELWLLFRALLARSRSKCLAWRSGLGEFPAAPEQSKVGRLVGSPIQSPPLRECDCRRRRRFFFRLRLRRQLNPSSCHNRWRCLPCNVAAEHQRRPAQRFNHP